MENMDIEKEKESKYSELPKHHKCSENSLDSKYYDDEKPSIFEKTVSVVVSLGIIAGICALFYYFPFGAISVLLLFMFFLPALMLSELS